jgi:sulfur-oxidizing protein SoxA
MSANARTPVWSSRGGPAGAWRADGPISEPRAAGGRLAGSVIPQAHPTGYPLYRLEWQGLGSLQRRLRGCMTGVRAEPFAAGSIEFVELELHLAARALGMAIETPAVRP